ncbi:hypothetical protein BDR22DRAFT_891448 [Usnea florida]
MEYLVPDPLSLELQKPDGRAPRYRNPQTVWLPFIFQDVNSFNNPEVLSQNALHPSGIKGTCQKLNTSLLNTMSHFRPIISNLNAPHPPVHADFLNTNQIVPEPPAQNDANIQHSLAPNLSPSYAISYSNANLQDGTAYSNLLEPQATLPTGDFDTYKTNNQGGFIIMEESPDCGYSPYTTLPHQQPLNTANNSNLFSTMDAESYNGPLCPFPKTESQDLASSGTSAALNMLDEQRPMSNLPAFYGSESTTASTGSETFIPSYSATNASVPSGWGHVGIHAPQETFNERCRPSEMVSCESQTGPSNSPSHSCAAGLYLPKIEESEDMEPLRMEDAMQIAPETSDSNELDDPSRRHHLIPGVSNYNTARLSDDLSICHTINDHVKQEDLDSSSASMHSPYIPNNVNPSTSDIWEVSTRADAPVNADSDISVENDMTRSIKADFNSLFSQWTTADDYGPNYSSTHHTGDVNAANQYNGNNTVTSEPNGSQHSKGQVIRDADSEETQPQRRKYQPRNKTNVLPAEVGHSKDTKAHDGHEYPSSTDRRKDPKDRYFCLDSNCSSSEVMGYRGFPNRSEAKRHINENGRHTIIKNYHCPFHHARGAQIRRFPRPDGLRAHIRTMHKDIDVNSPVIRKMIQAQKDAQKSTAVEPEHGVNFNVVSMR